MEFTKSELRLLHARSVPLGALLFLLDFVGFMLCSMGGLCAHDGARLACSMLAGLFMALLFVVGHDACHHALTPTRWVNRLLGTLAFLPSLHPYSLWDLGHNRIHHRFTNVRGKDYVWEPLSPREFNSHTWFCKLKYRFYRTAIGHLLYYPCEIWWRKMFFPRSTEIGGYQPRFIVDTMFVVIWLAGWSMVLYLALKTMGGQMSFYVELTRIAVAAVVPWLTFSALMSSVIYLHHTHSSVRWFTDDGTSRQSQRRASVHVILPLGINWVFHRIMEHTAHHCHPGIPLYRLLSAQSLLESRHDDIIIQKWSVGFHLRTLSECKLFDTVAQCWTDYAGRPTVPTIRVSPLKSRDASQSA